MALRPPLLRQTGAMAATQVPTPPATVGLGTLAESKDKSDSVASVSRQPATASHVPANAVATEVNSGVTETITPTPAQDPLAGIYYPRTQFGPPAGVAFEQVAGQSVAAFAAAMSSAPADGVRTALRDRIEPGTPHATNTQPGVARLDGTITRPR